MIQVEWSCLEGMFGRLTGTKVTGIHQDFPDDGCGRFFEVADPDGTWLQYHVNFDESAVNAGTTEAVVNVEIPVSDVYKSAAFYESIGFALERAPNAEVAFLQAGRLVDRFGYKNIPEFGIILTRRDNYPLMRFTREEAWEPVIELQTRDIEAYRSKLLERGIAVGDWHHGDPAGCILLHDPDGHMLGISTFAANVQIRNRAGLEAKVLTEMN
jgi:predicted enzyme related to lactoylglutathione lyase